jgi:hypothetical protein
LPLSARATVAVDPERRAPGRAVVDRTHVVDVALVAARTVLGVGVVHDVVRADADVAPAHVPPVRRVHVHEVRVGRTQADARGWERRACRDAGPRDAAVGRLLDDVLARRHAAAAFVHRRQEDLAVSARRDLDVADEACDDRNGSGPGRSAVIRPDDLEGAAADVEVVPADVCPAVEGAGRRVVDPARVPVVAAVAGSAGARRPGHAVVRRPDAEALASASAGEERCDPLGVQRVVHDGGIAK